MERYVRVELRKWWWETRSETRRGVFSLLARRADAIREIRDVSNARCRVGFTFCWIEEKSIKACGLTSKHCCQLALRFLTFFSGKRKIWTCEALDACFMSSKFFKIILFVKLIFKILIFKLILIFAFNKNLENQTISSRIFSLIKLRHF